MTGPEAHQLVRDRRDHRDQGDSRQDQQRQRHPAARDEAEEDDADDDHDQDEGRAAARMRGAEVINFVGRQWPLGFVGADRLVLGPVVGEDATDLPKGTDEADVSDEDHQPDGAFSQVRAKVATGAMHEAREGERRHEEDEDREANRDDHAHDHRPATDLDVLALGRDRRGAHQHPGAEHKRFVQHEHAASERDLDPPTASQCVGKRLRIGVDLSRGRAHAHGHRRPPAHHDALDQGLSAIEEVGHPKARAVARARYGADDERPGGDQQLGDEEEEVGRKARRPPGQAAAHRYQRSERSMRRWKRSTWPAVSTMFCVPV